MASRDDSDSADRLLVEVQLAAAGAMLADGRFVIEFRDGIGRLSECLRGFDLRQAPYSLDMRISELLPRSEREELERLRRIVRALPKEAVE